MAAVAYEQPASPRGVAPRGSLPSPVGARFYERSAPSPHAPRWPPSPLLGPAGGMPAPQSSAAATETAGEVPGPPAPRGLPSQRDLDAAQGGPAARLHAWRGGVAATGAPWPPPPVCDLVAAGRRHPAGPRQAAPLQLAVVADSRQAASPEAGWVARPRDRVCPHAVAGALGEGRAWARPGARSSAAAGRSAVTVPTSVRVDPPANRPWTPDSLPLPLSPRRPPGSLRSRGRAPPQSSVRPGG